jgi:hypothetical protein
MDFRGWIPPGFLWTVIATVIIGGYVVWHVVAFLLQHLRWI